MRRQNTHRRSLIARIVVFDCDERERVRVGRNAREVAVARAEQREPKARELFVAHRVRNGGDARLDLRGGMQTMGRSEEMEVGAMWTRCRVEGEK